MALTAVIVWSHSEIELFFVLLFLTLKGSLPNSLSPPTPWQPFPLGGKKNLYIDMLPLLWLVSTIKINFNIHCEAPEYMLSWTCDE